MQKIILLSLFILLLADLALLAGKLLSDSSPLVLSCAEGDFVQSDNVLALNSNARARVLKQGYAYYGFTDAQAAAIRRFRAERGDAALVIDVRLDAELSDETADASFMYGFLFARDFDSRGKLRGALDSRPLVHADVRRVPAGTLSLALQKAGEGDAQNDAPLGFFVYVAAPVSISRVEVADALIGFDLTSEVPFFGFAPNGGNVAENFLLENFLSGGVSQNLTADFSGAALVFPTQNTTASVMPEIAFSFAPLSDYGADGNQATSEVNAGGQTLTIYRKAGSDAYALQSSALSNPFATFGADAKLLSAVMRRARVKNAAAGGPPAPIPCDPGLIISFPRKNWRQADYELFEWDKFPGVLFFDTRNYDVQNDFFRRLAFYVEKAGFRGTLVDDATLAGRHAYNAHDYRAESLASFFAKAEAENFPLNEKELLLRDILFANGVIVKNASGAWEAGQGAVISISQDSAPWLRRRLLAHEGWHGIFFTDERFRNMTAAVYYTMDAQSLDFLKGYWSSQGDLNYDLSDEYLMHNEFMAYIMQQSVSAVAAYFVNLATNRASVQRAIPELAAYVRATRGVPFEDAAAVFNDYALTEWGLACGRVWLVDIN